MKPFIYKYADLLLVVIISVIPLIDLFHPGFPVLHDGQDHVARIANFYLSLTEGNLIPRWAANLNWGYGHPILMFLYPLPSYLASLFHFAGFSYIDSLKLLFGFAFVASGITMYLWIKSFLGRLPALSGAALYLFAPYRFVDLYVRGAIGEHVAFVFPPFVMYCLYKLKESKGKKPFVRYCYLVLASFSVAGLILAHNAISLMFFPLIILYAIYLFWEAKYNKILFVNFLAAIIIGFLLSAFFWMPAFFEGKYTLRDKVTAGEYITRFVQFKDLLYGQWNYGITGQFTTQIGIMQLILLFFIPISSIYLYIKERKLSVMLFVVLLYGVLAAFLMLNTSQEIWKVFSVLQKFQFPWRFLSVIVFCSAMVASLIVYSVKNTKKQILITILILIGALYFNSSYWHAKEFMQKPDSFFERTYYSTTDTGESAPVWSVRFMEKTAAGPIEIIEGEGDINPLSRSSTKHLYSINALTDVRIRENTLYFPGWKVLLNNQQLPVEFQDRLNRGLITFKLNKGVSRVEVVFQDTKLRQLANLVSLISLFMLITIGVYFKNRKST